MLLKMNVDSPGNWLCLSSEVVALFVTANECFEKFATHLDKVLMEKALVRLKGRFYVEIRIQTIESIHLLKWGLFLKNGDYLPKSVVIC